MDLNTSGIIIFAKCEYIQEALSKQMKDNIFKKEYLCIVNGTFPDDKKSGVINLPIERKQGSIIERCISKNGQPSITHYEVLKQYKDKNYSVVKCLLETGRTHQIRVHMSYIGYPVYGDPKYGWRKDDQTYGQFLHAKKLGFIHPTTNKYMEFESELPEYFKQKLIQLQEEMEYAK